MHKHNAGLLSTVLRGVVVDYGKLAGEFGQMSVYRMRGHNVCASVDPG